MVFPYFPHLQRGKRAEIGPKIGPIFGAISALLAPGGAKLQNSPLEVQKNHPYSCLINFIKTNVSAHKNKDIGRRHIQWKGKCYLKASAPKNGNYGRIFDASSALLAHWGRKITG